jgi:hypothetical protein
MRSAIESGYLVIPDVTGYTEFLTTSELEHAQDILDGLFESLMAHMKPPLIISGFRGDAILSYLPSGNISQGQTLLEMVDLLYFDFVEHREQAQYNTTCRCNACSNIQGLDLKVFLHHGQYLFQYFGEQKELLGPDVILVHRIMKNSVKEQTGLEGYVLITRQAIEAMGVGELAKDMIAHAEEYEHIGEVEMYVYSLQDAWEAERKKRRFEVTPDDAWVSGSVEVPVAPPVAWDYMTDLDKKVKYLGMESIARTDKLGGRAGEGSSYHCVHNLVQFTYKMLDWRPFEYFSARERTSNGLVYRKTYRITATENGSRFSMLFETPTEGDADAAAPLLQMLVDDSVETYADIIAKDLKEGKITVVGGSKLANALDGDAES